jgi:hypothetical protein
VRLAYIVRAARGHETKRLRCASAWVASEQRRRLVRRGWKVQVLDFAQKPVMDSLLEAFAEAEMEAAARGYQPPRMLPLVMT